MGSETEEPPDSNPASL